SCRILAHDRSFESPWRKGAIKGTSKHRWVVIDAPPRNWLAKPLATLARFVRLSRRRYANRMMTIFEKYPNSEFLKGLPADTEFFPLRKRIVELFRSFDSLEDPHFEQQLEQDAHARLWEMILAKILKSEGYELKSTDHGPDF